jgi:hypothetical protein
MRALSVVEFVGDVFKLYNYCRRLNYRIFDIWYVIIFVNVEILFPFAWSVLLRSITNKSMGAGRS